ncbi:hypothetical protein [Acinetobacter lwoffii]|uniref:hypothetical protein n=1 Tax=Acinetobacter lwoffii TaxID=28090 RepID=UPI003F90FF1B
MVASADIKFFVHTNNNAPQLQNAFGSMINVLDAALINGIQVGTVSSLTASGKIVTAVFGTAHNLMQYQVIKIAGANQAEYNVETRILTVPNATTITFELDVVPSTTIATGTINCSLPSLGWEKPFSSTSAIGGKAAYRSKNTLLPSRPFLRVVDELDPAYTATYAKFAKVGIVEDMTDIDTMLGVQAPYNSAAPNKNWVGAGSGTNAINGWAKWYYFFSSLGGNESTTPTGSARPWILVGTKDFFYIIPGGGNNQLEAMPYGFGIFSSILNIDSACNFLAATLRDFTAGSSASYFASESAIGHVDNVDRLLLQRGFNADQYKTATTKSLIPSTSQTLYSGQTNYGATKEIANRVFLLPVTIVEQTTNIIRGELPALKYLSQQLPYTDLQIFVEKKEVFIAKTAAVFGGSLGQIVLKIGEL